MSQDIKKYVDTDSGLGRLRGNKKLYTRMLNMFLASDEMEKFEAAIAENDLVKAADVAHAIKGMTGNLSLTAVFDMSARLMVELREGTLDQGLIDAFREAYALTRGYVEQTIAELSA